MLRPVEVPSAKMCAKAQVCVAYSCAEQFENVSLKKSQVKTNPSPINGHIWWMLLARICCDTSQYISVVPERELFSLRQLLIYERFPLGNKLLDLSRHWVHYYRAVTCCWL